MMGTIGISSTGTPKPENWGSQTGFVHPNPRIDDNLTMDAATRMNYLHSEGGRKATQDVGAMEIQWDRATQGQNGLRDKDLVPHWVADRGSRSVEHQQNVENLIRGAVRGGDAAVQSLEGDFLNVYRNAVRAAGRGERW
jgi:hypothetical protein